MNGIGKVVIVAVGMLALVLAIGFIMNTVAVPATNAIWSNAGRKRCDKDPTASKTIVVFIPVFGKTAIPEVKVLLKRVFTAASCPFRVRVVLVAFGEDRSDILELPTKIQKGLMFKGVKGFVVSERIVAVDGGELAAGPLAAFAIGANAQLQDSDYAVLTAPSGEMRSQWDKTLIDELNTTPKPQATVLTYAHTAETMQNTTFPLIAVNDNGSLPTVRWMQYSRKPSQCFTCKSLSPDFAFMPTGILKTEGGKQLLSLLANAHLACPPSFFGVFCAGLLDRAEVEIRTPMTLVTTPVRSLGMNNYRQVLRSELGREVSSASTTLVHTTMREQLSGSSFERNILGVSISGTKNTQSGIMGLTPSAHEDEIEAKYGSLEELERQATVVQSKLQSSLA